MPDSTKLDEVLAVFAAIDELAIVVSPGNTDRNQVDKLVKHCENLGDRFAVLDGPEEGDNSAAPTFDGDSMPTSSHFGAMYHPWLQVFDPELKQGEGKEMKTGAPRFVPPSGHVAGIYARVDATRGVHKAPANEIVYGALGLRWRVNTETQGVLNEKGINCIRDMNGDIRVWGARTFDPNSTEFRYINVRRLFSYLNDSLRVGLQWTVFEPNNADLWARITRNVTSFLTTVWASGALFGSSPEEAFYVKCDAETNPPDQRDLGRVVTEIGVAIVRPAEFVIIRLGQWNGPAK
nr:phage tail sheath C-terminal domain-containing protein [Archangium primigenium]